MRATSFRVIPMCGPDSYGASSKYSAYGVKHWKYDCYIVFLKPTPKPNATHSGQAQILADLHIGLDSKLFFW